MCFKRDLCLLAQIDIPVTTAFSNLPAWHGGGKHPPYGRYASCPHRTLESLPLEGKVAFAKQMTDEVATTRKPSWTCPLISHGSSVPASPKGEAFWKCCANPQTQIYPIKPPRSPVSAPPWPGPPLSARRPPPDTSARCSAPVRPHLSREALPARAPHPGLRPRRHSGRPSPG